MVYDVFVSYSSRDYFDMDNLMNGDFNKELPEALKRDKNGRYLGYDLQIK